MVCPYLILLIGIDSKDSKLTLIKADLNQTDAF